MNGTRFWTCFVLMAAILFISPTGIRAEEKKAEAKKAKPAAKKPKPDFPAFDMAM